MSPIVGYAKELCRFPKPRGSFSLKGENEIFLSVILYDKEKKNL